MLNWRKAGNIFCPENNYSWMISHAANPFAVALNSTQYRIYFTCRDASSRSHIGFVDIDFENDYKVIGLSDQPVVAPGDPGYYDDSGAAMGYYLDDGKQRLIYYLGWNLKVTVPWQNSIGLAIYDERSQNFVKVRKAPLLDRSDEDPFSISYPSVLMENGIYKMWYGSNLSWGKDQSEMNHVIKYATSKDGINWSRTGKICLTTTPPHEYALSKPFVIKAGNVYHMWYSYRGSENSSTYRIGYAESYNGEDWIRKDNLAGIGVSSAGWDNEMICYPFVFVHKGKYHMLYNGNGYGRTGFGLAIQE